MVGRRPSPERHPIAAGTRLKEAPLSYLSLCVLRPMHDCLLISRLSQWGPDMTRVPSPDRSVWYLVGRAALAVLGFVVLLLGMVLCATFWLLPVGLPLGLLGAAFMGAAGESPPVKSGPKPASVVLSPKKAVREPPVLPECTPGSLQGLAVLAPVSVEDPGSLETGWRA